MFPELKHYLCDKEVNIKQTVIGHLEMLAQKFEYYYGEAITPSEKMIGYLIHLQAQICLIHLSMLQKSLWT